MTMPVTKASMQFSRGKDTTISLSSGEVIDVWINKYIFTSDGSLKTQQEFKDIENTHLLSFQWPSEVLLTAVTQWTPQVTIRSLERKHGFAQSTAEELGREKWEIVKRVMEKCHTQFDACLLEVSFWGVKLGHKDMKSAQHTKDNMGSMIGLLIYLLADTEYLFRDVVIQWSFSFIIDGDGPVQGLLRTNSLVVDGPGSPLSCFSRGNSQEHQHMDMSNTAGEKQILSRFLEEIQQVKQSVLDIKQQVEREIQEVKQSVLDIKEQVEKNHKEVFERLEEGRNFSSKPHCLPQTQTDSNGAVGLLTPEPSVQETHPRHQRERPRLGQASQSRRTNRENSPSDSGGDNRWRHKEHASDQTRRSSSQESRQHGDVPHRPANVGLIAGDDNYINRNKNKPGTKENHGNPKKANNLDSEYGRQNETSVASAANPIFQSPSKQLSSQTVFTASSNTTLNRPPSNRTSHNMPSAARGQTSPSSHPLSNHQTPHSQISSQRTSSPPSGQFASFSSATVASVTVTDTGNSLPFNNERRERSQWRSSSLNNGSSVLSSPTVPGRQNETHQESKETVVSPVETKTVAEDIVLMVESESEARLVKESVRRAHMADEVKPPKSRSFDTVLCLDISESMKQGGAFEMMKETALALIDGVEDIAMNFSIEENLGLVTFGGRANVVQNLTNDFSLIRDKIDLMEPGGKSPFVEALLVAMAAFVRKGGIVEVSGEWRVKPRIIFISDGLPTESKENNGLDVASNINNVRLSLSRVLMSFKSSDKFQKIHPVVFIPVGQKADRSYMKNMSTLCDGVFTEPENIGDLCHHFRMQEIIGKVLACLRGELKELDQEKTDATLMALAPDLSDVERVKVVEVVQQELANPSRKHSSHPKPTELDSVFEDTDKTNKGERLPLGTRVIRGPDWEYDNQDGGGPGTVINHHDGRSLHWVNWDNRDYNCYPYSERHGYHIWKTEEHPRLRKHNEPLEIGMTVKKGKDWKPIQGQQEQGEGQGVLIRKSTAKGKVVVRWSNAVIQVCQWSPTGFQEVEYCPPHVNMGKVQHLRQAPADQHPAPSVAVTRSFEGQGIWQWHDGHRMWQSYDKAVNDEIEATCKRKNTRTCIIERDGETYLPFYVQTPYLIYKDGGENS